MLKSLSNWAKAADRRFQARTPSGPLPLLQGLLPHTATDQYNRSNSERLHPVIVDCELQSKRSPVLAPLHDELGVGLDCISAMRPSNTVQNSTVMAACLDSNSTAWTQICSSMSRLFFSMSYNLVNCLRYCLDLLNASDHNS